MCFTLSFLVRGGPRDGTTGLDVFRRGGYSSGSGRERSFFYTVLIPKKLVIKPTYIYVGLVYVLFLIVTGEKWFTPFTTATAAAASCVCWVFYFIPRCALFVVCGVGLSRPLRHACP